VFSVGVGVLYRPNEAKVRNVKAKDYLGKARLVAASDAQNAFTGFAGTEVKKVRPGRAPYYTNWKLTGGTANEFRELGDR
jgi:hypothetical protein